tara:strand:- start:740 stop:1003 length:264 start_codon:yes stop_codon:yes gene_type:complete
MEVRVDIDTRELADDGMFCDIVGDIAADVIRDSGEVEHIVTSTIENDIGYHIEQHIQCSSVLDPDDDDFIKVVAKAILNMARSYVGE